MWGDVKKKTKKKLFSQTYPVTCHTDHVGNGSTFVAIDGYQEKGSFYTKKAARKGAAFFIEGSEEFTRKKLAELAAQSLSYPAKKLKIIGITGTAGKTTTTYLIEHMLQTAGYKTALIGGIVNRILDDEEESVLTTPSADYLHMFFAECVKRGVTHVVMEISSIALFLFRVYGITFDAVGFTNLSPEHLDFHKTMEDYFQAKCMIFDAVKKDGTIVINTDDEWGKKAYTKLQIKKNCFALCEKKYEVAALIGEFNKKNSSMAAIICEVLGVKNEVLQKACTSFQGVPGRLEKYELANGAVAFIDYAHKPLSFKNVLQALRPLTNDLIVVFGCGGNRDTKKRPIMGALSVQYADRIVLTNDNSRNENSDAIMHDILQGIPKPERKKIIIEKKRKSAFKKAYALSKEGSIIAFLGKGHEMYTVEKGQKSFESDREIVDLYKKPAPF